FNRQLHGELAPRQKLLDDNEWLFARARNHSENIEQYVVINPRKAWIANSGTEGCIPFIAFTIKIINNSVFDVAIDEKISGEIFFKNKGFKRDNGLDRPPTCLRSGETETLVIYQRLYEEEVKHIDVGWHEYITNNEAPGLNFQLSGLQ